LTAAHCLRNVSSPDALTVVHGSNYWPDGKVAKVSQFFTHEKYDKPMHRNDVALLKLATPLVFDKLTQPVPLRKSPVPTGATVVVSGFGRTGYNEHSSEHLKHAEMTVIASEECATKTKHFYEGLICVNGPIETGTCKGDSGGPAVYKGELVGVANLILKKGVCGSAQPDAFAKVSYFFDWIQGHMK
jgi:secreted trypsin-like serine protease